MNESSAATLDRDTDIDRVADALSVSTRRGLLRLVRTSERTAGDLAEHFPEISRPAVSQHLRVLSDAGLVAVRPDGRRRLYSARVEALSPVSTFIDEMWRDRLIDLKRAAEARERGDHS
ncbi:MAG: metalloregulator ArsR/SmtB family transcription factor [Actinomycetota bacterium]